MSLEGRELRVIGCKAAGAIAENTFVTLDSSDTTKDIAVKQAGASDAIYGINAHAITSDEATAGATASIVVGGEGKLLVLGATPGTITPGCQLAADADGEGKLTTTALDDVGAVALGASSTEGDEIPVSVRPFSSVKAAS